MASVATFFIDGGPPAWGLLALVVLTLLALMPLSVLQARAPRGPLVWLTAPMLLTAAGVGGVRHGMSTLLPALDTGAMHQRYALFLVGESVALIPGVLAAAGVALVCGIGLLSVALSARKHLVGTRLVGVGAASVAVAVGGVLLVIGAEPGPLGHSYDWMAPVALVVFGVLGARIGGPLSDRRERVPVPLANIAVSIAVLGVVMVAAAGTAAVFLTSRGLMPIIAHAPPDQQALTLAAFAAAAAAATAVRSVALGVAGVVGVLLLAVARRGVVAAPLTVVAGVLAGGGIVAAGHWLEASLDEDFATLTGRVPAFAASQQLARSTSRRLAPGAEIAPWPAGTAANAFVADASGKIRSADPALAVLPEATVSAGEMGDALASLHAEADAARIALLAAPADVATLAPVLWAGPRPAPPALRSLIVDLGPPATPTPVGLLVDRGRVTVQGVRPFEARPQDTGARWATLTRHLARIRDAHRRERRVAVAATEAVTVGELVAVLDASRETDDGDALFPEVFWVTPDALATAVTTERPATDAATDAGPVDDDPLVP